MNYTEIVAAAKAYADRNDSEINANVDVFLKMSESKINRVLRVSEMTVRATVSTITDKEYYALPPDFSGMRDAELQIGSTRHPLEYLPPSQMNIIYNYEESTNYYYTILAGNLHLLPIQDAGALIEMVYYQKLPPLDGVIIESNWVSETYPDIYIAAMMVEIESFVKNAEAVTIWEARFDKAIAALDLADSKDRWSGPPLRTRTQ